MERILTILLIVGLAAGDQKIGVEKDIHLNEVVAKEVSSTDGKDTDNKEANHLELLTTYQSNSVKEVSGPTTTKLDIADSNKTDPTTTTTEAAYYEEVYEDEKSGEIKHREKRAATVITYYDSITCFSCFSCASPTVGSTSAIGCPSGFSCFKLDWSSNFRALRGCFPACIDLKPKWLCCETAYCNKAFRISSSIHTMVIIIPFLLMLRHTW